MASYRYHHSGRNIYQETDYESDFTKKVNQSHWLALNIGHVGKLVIKVGEY